VASSCSASNGGESRSSGFIVTKHEINRASVKLPARLLITGVHHKVVNERPAGTLRGDQRATQWRAAKSYHQDWARLMGLVRDPDQQVVR
jgi:hypothetical protein